MKNRESIKVWDPFVRIFHWSLVVSFIVAYVTQEEILPIHTLAGYIIIGLLSLRVIWGFVGTSYSRFSAFLYSPATIRQFLIDTFRFRASRYVGHNPAGGAMIFLLIASLLMTTVSGLVIHGVEDNAGPLAGLVYGASALMGEFSEEIHEFFANFTIFLVIVHVAGVLLESLIHRENLFLSMITGTKRASASAAEEVTR